MTTRRLVTAAAVSALLLTAIVAVEQQAFADPIEEGTLTVAAAPSPTLGEDIAYTVYLPYGYAESTEEYASLYLLHGRGDTMDAWTQVKAELDELIHEGKIDPVVVVMPDAPWSQRGSYYVDSAYTGEDPGRPVETAFVTDLVAHVDETYRTVDDRAARGVGGYSMGAAGALRYALAHQDVFSAALVLSPAVYTPLPPEDSSAREFGAYGQGDDPFVEEIYESLNYPALLPEVDTDLPVHMFIAVGDDEYVNPEPEDALHDIDTESALLYSRVKRTAGVTAELRVVDGGHDWGVWQPMFVEGVQDLFRYLTTTPAPGLVGPLLGTAGDDRAGGVVAGGDGAVTIALAAAGSVDGQPHAGGLDVVVTKRDAAGTTAWTTQLGTTATDRPYGLAGGPDGELYVAGYTAGDLDGDHPAGGDDAFVVRLEADGSEAWRTQFGDPEQADRVYSAAAAPDGGVYVAGYTRGSIGGVPNVGDKDVFVAYVDSAGEVGWVKQFGSAGEDKGLAVTVDARGHVFAAGIAGDALPGTESLGGYDGWVASFDDDGTHRWTRQVGTETTDQLNGLAPRTPGGVYATGESEGVMGKRNHGGDDVVTMSFGGKGRERWVRQSGTADDDRGADVVVRADGRLEVAAYSNGRFVEPAGAFDVAMLTLGPRKGRVHRVSQFGTPANDGSDLFGEESLYVVGAGDALWVSGLTYGSSAETPNLGEGDVFTLEIDPGTGLPEVP